MPRDQWSKRIGRLARHKATALFLPLCACSGELGEPDERTASTDSPLNQSTSFGAVQLGTPLPWTPGIVAQPPAPLQLIDIGPVSNGHFVAAREAAGSLEDPEAYLLRFHVELKNTGTTDLTVTSIEADSDVTSPQTVEFSDTNAVIEAGESEIYKVTIEGAAPLPTSAAIRLSFAQNFPAFVVSRSVMRYENETFTGGYRFPAKLADLPAGTSWRQGRHAHARTQAHSLDLGARRWRDNEYVKYTEQAYADQRKGVALGSKNEHFLIWGTPIYSMYDGVIVKCRRLRPDNVPGTTQSGSNLLVIDHGNGEVAVYAHLKQYSIPEALCPREIWEDDDELAPPVPVEIGQFLGQVGNSGPSGGPHLHLSLNDRRPSADGPEQNLPLNFGDVETRFDDYAGDEQEPDWKSVPWSSPKAMGKAQLLRPNPNGWTPGALQVLMPEPVYTAR